MFGKKKISIVIAASMLFSMPVSANVGTGMNDLFNSVGGFANATPPSAYKGQTMNGYSGGGFYARTPVKNYQLMTAQAPSLNIGCGGIDLTAGSFSHINEAALTAMLQNIGTSLGYAFLLAIKSSMPEMASLFEYLQDAAAKANAMNINTCQLTKGIPFVDKGSLSENLEAMRGHVASQTTSLYTDSMQALKATKDDAAKRREATTAAIAADPSKKEFYRPGNVVWRALDKTSGLDTEDKEFLMSFMGTIIINESSGSGTAGGSKAGAWEYKRPLFSSARDFIGYYDATNSVEKMKIYKCTELVDCKTMTEVDISITSFRKLISTKIDNLKNNLQGRQQQTSSDLKLMEASTISVWKLITVAGQTSPDLLEKYKDYIAIDLAYEYVNEIVQVANQTAISGAIQPAAEDAKQALEQLQGNLTKLSTELHQQRVDLTNSVLQTAELERQLQFIHQATVAGIPAQAFNSMRVFK